MENIIFDVEELKKATRHNQKTVGCVTTSDIAKMYQMSTKDLVSFLRDIGILMPKGTLTLTRKYMGKGLALERQCVHFSLEGQMKSHTYLVWTQKGKSFLQELIGKYD